MMTSITPLRGEALHAVLDRAWELLNPADEDDAPEISAAERQARAIDLLHRHTFAPVNLDELGYLHGMWLTLEQPETATAVLHQHRAAVLAAGSADITTALALELMELTSRWHLDPGGGQDRLAAVLAQLHTHAATLETLEDQWESLAIQYHAWELLDVHLDWKHQQMQSDLPAAVRDGLYHEQKAGIARQRGNQDAADRHIRLAIAHRAETLEGGIASLNEWKRFAEHGVLQLAPRQMGTLVQAARAHLGTITPPLPIPIRREWDVRFARWQAWACQRLEHWDEAVHHARRGHYVLDDDASHADTLLASAIPDLLVQAGHMDEAAEVAWRGIWTAPENGMAIRAYELALEMHDKDTRTPTWNWILASAHYRDGLLHARQGRGLLDHLRRPLPLPARAYLDRARQIAPDHPAPDLIEGVHLAQQGQWQAALPLLERGVLALPELADAVSVSLLWCARFKCLPEDEAIQRPFPDCGSADWAQEVGRNLLGWKTAINPISEVCRGEISDHTWEQRQALGLRYWENARIRYEAFFASGEGARHDANLWHYATACNIAARTLMDQGRIDAAIPILQAGLASGMPSWKHYSKLMECFRAKDDWRAILALAEPFWQNVQDRAERDGDLFAGCSHKIAYALHKEQRHHEISIWIDRLHQWWEQCQRHDDDRDTALNRGDYLCALLGLLQTYSIQSPRLAEPILRTHLPEILALDEDSSGSTSVGNIWRDSATILHNCSCYDEAVAMYDKALAVAEADNNTVLIEEIRTFLAQSEQAAGGRRRTSIRKFWQFWK